MLDERSMQVDTVRAGTPAVLETDARAMEALEGAGLSLSEILGASERSNRSLMKTEAWSTLAATIEADIRDLETRPGITDWHPRKRFQLSWLSDPRARFDLVAVVNRLDRSSSTPRRAAKPASCIASSLRPTGVRRRPCR